MTRASGTRKVARHYVLGTNTTTDGMLLKLDYNPLGHTAPYHPGVRNFLLVDDDLYRVGWLERPSSLNPFPWWLCK